ncbi:MAG: hypothetical protein NHG08_00265 [Candidatus Shikimatogenerans sp. JK-2022]|nr:hypothetical protein [Candidatus Shikimatogenerans bostrichidophilus]
MNIVILNFFLKEKIINKILNIINIKNLNIIITNNKKKILKSDKIILYSNLSIKKNLKIINYNKLFFLKNINKPILSINTGFNILCSNYNNYKGLNIFKNIKVNSFKTKKIKFNRIFFDKNDLLFKNINKNYIYQFFYIKYFILLGKFTVSHTNYKITYSSILKKKNIYGLQFDPIMSNNKYSKIIINNFIKYIK